MGARFGDQTVRARSGLASRYRADMNPLLATALPGRASRTVSSSLCMLLFLSLTTCGSDGSAGTPDLQPHDAGVPPIEGAPGTAQLVDSTAELSPTAEHLQLTLVDVGQGDGMVLTLPDGTAAAIDGGPDRFAAYRDYISTAVKGGLRLEAVLLSHGHSDHYTGLTTAIDWLPKDCGARVFDPGYDRPDIPGYQSFKAAAGCRYRTFGKGMSLSLFPSVRIEILSVTDTPFPMQDSSGINNTSAITYVRFGRFALLLMGDAETQAERLLWDEKKDSLRANVLKLGHHGSCNATATSLLAAVSPDYALIGVGRPNDFGHPHCQTLNKLKARGMHWLRSDSNGTITVETDGEKYAVRFATGSPDDTRCPRDCSGAPDF